MVDIKRLGFRIQMFEKTRSFQKNDQMIILPAGK
jgi:hypothetical protein